MCWPAYIVGAFFVALVAFDIIQKDYSSLPQHGLIGVCVTGLLWLLCWVIGPSITMATLVVPLIFIGIFLFSVWLMNESMKARGCCMTCNGDKEKKGRLVKRTVPKNAASVVSSGSDTSILPASISASESASESAAVSGPVSGSCTPSLKAVPL
jgi:hypothetical protein